MELFWQFVFFDFAFAALIVWAFLLSRSRIQLRRISAILTMFFVTVCAFQGAWAQFHLSQLQARKAFDYGFEGATWLLSIGAVIAAIVWTMRSRARISFFALLLSGAMCFVWMTICATF